MYSLHLDRSIIQPIGAPGFEPGTSCSQSRRDTRLRYAPRTAYPNAMSLKYNIREGNAPAWPGRLLHSGQVGLARLRRHTGPEYIGP